DVTTPELAKQMMDTTGCDGVMIGRGALGQPWIFRDAAHYLRTGELPPPVPQRDRARLVIDHFEHMLRLRDERYAINTIRTRMSWYSRYLQPWPGLKREVQDITSAEQFRDFMAAGIARMTELPMGDMASVA